MRKYVKQYISSCINCCYNKIKPGKTEATLYLDNLEPIPFRKLHIDHLGPFVRSKKGNTHIVAISDAFSKYLIVKAVRDTKTAAVIKILNELSSYFGLPKCIITDRGTAYTSKSFAEYCEMHCIQHIKTAVRTPRANGQVERANQTILTILRTTNGDKNTWDEQLHELQWIMNSQANKTTGFSPNELVFDFKLLDIVTNQLVAALQEEQTGPDERELSIKDKRQQVIENMQKEKERWKRYFDQRHRTPMQYQVNDLVVLENEPSATGESRKLAPKYRGPYVISKCLGNDRYLIKDLDDLQITNKKFTSVYAADKIKPWCKSSPLLDDQDDDNDEMFDSIEDDPMSGKAELSGNTAATQ